MRLPLILALGASLAACVAGPAPEIATPPPALPKSFFYAPDIATQSDVSALMPTGDPAFTTLAAAALESGPSLAEALARVDAARARAARAGAERLPEIGADASVTGTRTNPSQFGSNTPFAQFIDTERVSYGANLSARWDADIFGRLRSQERAALARIDAASASAAAVRIALLGEIAASTTDWRVIEAREAALLSDVAAATRLAELAGVREEAGIAPGFDRVRAEAAASASRVRLAALRSDKARLTGRLIALTGLSGVEVAAALAQDGAGSAVSAVSAPPASLPSELLVNRPDVVAAAAELAATDADLAAAARARFPRLTLSAVLGLLAFNPADLFDSDALIGTLAGNVAAPLVDFGRIEAEIDGAAAGKRAAFAAYRGAVYAALGDAEAAYGLVAAADAEAALARREHVALQRAADIAETRYRAGLASFLEVLDARRAADASGERNAAALGRAQRARIVLWQALGGDGL